MPHLKNLYIELDLVSDVLYYGQFIYNEITNHTK